MCSCVRAFVHAVCVCMCVCVCVCVCVSVQMAIVAGGGVEVIVAAMRTHATVPGVVQAGCAALGNLAKDHTDNQVGVDGGEAQRDG
jgi:hypothetical protein